MEVLKDFPIDQIKPYARNPRKNEKAVKEVMKSIQKVGYRTPVVVDENMEILVGHTRWKAMKELGHKTLNIIQYKDLTKEQKDDYRILDNKTGEVAEWDFDILMEDFDKEHLLDLGFSIKDLPMGEVIEDEAPPVPEIPKTVKGDLYELGNHKLLCGDSTIITDVEKLMDGQKADMVFTDPPYNVGFKGQLLSNTTKGGVPVLNHKGANTKHEGIKNDEMADDEFIEFIKQVLSNIILFNKGAWYYCFSDLKLDLILRPLRDLGLSWKSIIVWKKNQATLSAKDYKSTYEPIIYGCPPNSFYGERYKQEDVWEFQRTLKNDLHPTMKPLSLIANALNNSSRIDDIVMDLFLGSGSTLIACEQTNRKCYGMELDEKYCDVIVQRYVNFTKNTKIKLNGKEIEWPVNSEKNPTNG